VGTDDEWVVWTRSGYFTASAGGVSRIGWHVNHGAEKEAEWFPAERFYRLYYNPEFVAAVYRYGSEEKARLYAKAVVKETASVLPPRIRLVSPGSTEFETEEERLFLRFCLEEESAEPTKEVKVLLNGAVVTRRALKRKESGKCYTEELELSPGENLITILARNRYAQANPVNIRVKRRVKKIEELFKPELYLLAVGVSRYKEPDYRLRYARADAEAVVKTFRRMEGKLFRKVHVRLLVDEEATKDNLLDALDWLDREATQHDVVVVFLAGHGENDKRGNYYFLTYEMDPERLRRTAIRWVEFEDLVTGLNSKVLFFVDTCRAGNIYTARRALGPNILEALHSLKDAGVGTVIFSATTGVGYSYEDERWGHGAFTKALIDGLMGFGADYDGNRVITVRELDLYLTKRVKELTHGRQKPTTIIPSAVPDFAVYVE